jgi:hypothetical protein
LALEGPRSVDQRINAHLREAVSELDVICIEPNDLLWTEVQLLCRLAATRVISAANQ